GQLRDQALERALAEPALRRPRVLVEGRQRRLVVARDAQRTVAHDALHVDHVADGLLDRPLARRVPPVRRLSLERPQRPDRRPDARAEDLRQVPRRDPADVTRVVRRILVRRRTPAVAHAASFAVRKLGGRSWAGKGVFSPPRAVKTSVRQQWPDSGDSTPIPPPPVYILARRAFY